MYKNYKCKMKLEKDKSRSIKTIHVNKNYTYKMKLEKVKSRNVVLFMA